MALFDGPRIAARANADPEMRIAARLWDGSIRLEADAERCDFAVRGGVLSAEPVKEPAVLVSGPVAGWREMLAAVPRPFYQDLMAAQAHHGFRVTGGESALYPYYPAMRRLVELLRALASEA